MNNPYDNCGIHSGAQFDGETYIPTLDHKRLTGQLKRVYDVMSDGKWHDLAFLSLCADAPEGSCSARLRDLRKDKFGAHTVDRKRDKTIPGLWLYRLEVDPRRELSFSAPTHQCPDCDGSGLACTISGNCMECGGSGIAPDSHVPTRADQ